MKVQVEKVGNRIHMRAPYPVAGLKSAVPGAYFSEQKQRWTFPLSMETCQLLRERFGADLEIFPELWSWAKQEKAKRAEMGDLAKQSDAELHDLPRLAPKLAAAMESRSYQRVAVRFVADTDGGTLIADTVGLGKTLEALGAVLESGAIGPYLVVSPKTAVLDVWAPEIQRWLGEYGHEVVTLPEGRAKRDAVLDALHRNVDSFVKTWLIVHPEAVRTKSWWICRECGSQTAKTSKPKELECGHDPRNSRDLHDHTFQQIFQQQWGAIVVDESDKSLIRLSGTPNQTRNGMEILRDMNPDALRIAMSGTPFRSRPHLLWSTLNWLRPNEYRGFWNWAKLYWELGGYSGWELGRFKTEREGMLWDSLKKVMLRRTRAEVASELPERNYLSNRDDLPPGIWLPMEPAQEKAYREMRDLGSAEIAGGRLDAVGILAEMTRLKQFAIGYGALDARREFRPAAPSNKYLYCLQMLQELGFPDDPQTKVIIVSQFTQWIKAFADWFQRDLATSKHPMVIGTITGEDSARARSESIRSFEDVENRSCSLMLLNVKAGGSAITLDAANEMVFLDETWIPDDQEQAEGRNDNRNPERKIVQRNYRYLRSLDSIEMAIALANAERKERSHSILDGRRGVEFANRVLEIAGMK